jgi:hypothetical protein
MPSLRFGDNLPRHAMLHNALASGVNDIEPDTANLIMGLGRPCPLNMKCEAIHRGDQQRSPEPSWVSANPLAFITLRRSRNTRSYYLVESYRDQEGRARRGLPDTHRLAVRACRQSETHLSIFQCSTMTVCCNLPNLQPADEMRVS